MPLSRPLLVLGAVAAAGVTWAALRKPKKTKKPLVTAVRPKATGPQNPARTYQDDIDRGFDAAFEACEQMGTFDDVLRCIAPRIFPAQTWPPPPGAPSWHQAAWRMMGNLGREAVGLDPRPAG